MAHYKYIILETKDDPVTMGGKLRVIMQGRQRTLKKAGSLDSTIEGGLDKTSGGVYESITYMVRVRQDEPDTGWMDYSELEALFRLVDPGADPHDTLKYVDHLGNVEDAWLIGNFTDNVMGCQIEGTDAWHIVQIIVQVLP